MLLFLICLEEFKECNVDLLDNTRKIDNSNNNSINDNQTTKKENNIITSRIGVTDIFRLNYLLRAHKHAPSMGARPAHSAALAITGKDKLHCIYYMYFRQ